MKEQFLNLSGLTDLVTYMKLCIAQHKVIIPRASFSLFPETGDENNIYIDTSTNAIYRWNDTDKKFVLLAKPPRTIAISEGTNNGEITLKVDNIASNAKVHGLTSTAFTESNKFATAAQGAKADSAVQTITLSSGTKNGTIKIKVNNITTDNIEVAGLGSAAFSDIGIFAAKSHTHKKDEVGLGNVDNTADINKSVKYATSAGAVSWKNITDKPTLFPPTDHNHDSLYYRKNEVDSLLSGKSDTGHTHVQFIQEVKFSNGTYSDPLNGTAVAIKASGGIASDLIYEGGKTLADKYQAKGSYAAASHKQAYTSGECTTYNVDDNTMGVTPAAVKKAFGIFGPKAHTHKKSDITDFPTSLPASDVYAWAKASSKPSYSWGEITGKPSTFTPSSHNHTVIQGTSSTSAVPGKANDGFCEFYYNVNNGLANNMPSSNNANAIISISRHAGDYTSQLGFSSNGNLYYREGVGATAWKTILTSSNYTSYTVTKTGGGASGTWGINITGSSGSCTGNAATASNASKVNGHTVNSDVPSGAKFTDTNTWRPLGTAANTACAGNDSRLSNSRPASDVYSWAKASSKPSYSWSEITSKPSTFTPASHTHAYIPLSGGTITGSIIRSSGGSWISARNNVAVRGTATGKDSWNPVVGQATPNGYWTIGNLASNDNLAFSYTSNTNYNAGNNSATTVYLPVQEGTIITSATIGSQSVKYATSAGSAGSVAWGNVSGKPSSYTPSSHTHDDRYYTETEINTKLGTKLGAVSANGYYGMARPDGNTSDWIRTTTAGIIPYQSGGAGGGHCGLGTSSWYFGAAYIDTVNCVNTNASGYLQANGLINTYSEYQSQKGKRDWRFGSATGNGDQNWFGFYDYTSGFHGGWYGPDHIFRAYGELQSTSANSFRSVYGNYGFIIRNDGANIYFMMTKSGDPYGIWNDNYTIFTPNGEWQVKKSPYDNGMSTERGYVVVSDSNDNRVYSISNYNANYLKVRCGLNTYHCTYSNSDIRLKKNINNTSITNALSVINSIKVRQFDWKETNIHQSIGFVADELEKLDPNFSQGGGVTKDGGIDVKSVNSFYLQGYIVKALQELSSQVSDLKQENKRLKQKLNMCN